MSKEFAKKWGTLERVDRLSKIKGLIHSPGPLKPRLNDATKRIRLQVQRLDKATARFSERDKSIFAKVVDAYSKHEMARASALANELAEIRKMEKMIVQARLALEQIVLRLSTVSELGDVVATLAPAVGVLHNVRTGMGAVFPEAERELGSIGNLLNGIIIDAGQTGGLNIDFETANDDAQTVLAEAAAVAEQTIKNKFPQLPAPVPAIGEKILTEG